MTGFVNTMHLVSVCVITYNSSKTIIETLESIFAQTYPNIELVISDDCSTDETVPKCKEWLNKFGSRFAKTILVERSENGGLPKNLNSGIRASSGEWIKTIAGDDILLPNCIQDNVDFVSKTPEAQIVFSKLQYFTVVDGKNVLMDSFRPEDRHKYIYSLSAEKQHEIMMENFDISWTTLFASRALALDNPYPEEYPYFEDYPQALRLTGKGIKFYYFDKLTVLYRRSVSLAHAPTDTYLSVRFHDSVMRFFQMEYIGMVQTMHPELVEKLRKELCLGEVAILAFNNRKSLISRAVLFLLKKKLKVEKAK